MKLRLDIDLMSNDFFDDVRLIGIVAPMRSYLFCWQLNKNLGYNFRLNNDIEIETMKKGRKYFFSIYHHIEKNSPLQHFVYHNQCDGEFLLPEFKYMDFLWLMKGDPVDEVKCVGYLASIKSIAGVQMVSELTLDKIKNKGALMF